MSARTRSVAALQILLFICFPLAYENEQCVRARARLVTIYNYSTRKTLNEAEQKEKSFCWNR